MDPHNTTYIVGRYGDFLENKATIKIILTK
jgi:hypothetical protein